MSFDGDNEDANEIIPLDESSKKESRAEDGSENNEITIHPTNEILSDEQNKEPTTLIMNMISDAHN